MSLSVANAVAERFSGVLSRYQVYQYSSPELFDRLENLTFNGESEVEVDGVTYAAVRDIDAEGEFYVLLAKG